MVPSKGDLALIRGKLRLVEAGDAAGVTTRDVDPSTFGREGNWFPLDEVEALWRPSWTFR